MDSSFFLLKLRESQKTFDLVLVLDVVTFTLFYMWVVTQMVL